jgi:hypothetical protein
MVDMEWMNKEDFSKIEVGDAHIRGKYMIGDCKVVKAPYTSNGNDCIKVVFLKSPWKDKGEIELIRQGIKPINCTAKNRMCGKHQDDCKTC